MNCVHCGKPVPDGGRRDRLYCTRNCSKRASEARRKTGSPPPRRWQHPALSSNNPALRSAATRAEHLMQTHGWTITLLIRVLDGLTVALDGRPPGDLVTLTEVRAHTPPNSSGVRVAEVLADVELLDDNTVPAIHPWIGRRCGELPAGFAGDVRDWLLVLLNGDTRTRPRSAGTIYVYFGSVRPLLLSWSATRGCLREITAADVTTALHAMTGWPRRTAMTALRSLFRFATKNGLIFANPTARLHGPDAERSPPLPMTDAEIRAIEQITVTAAQRLVVTLAAVHAARTAAIRHLTLDALDMPNRRITLAGHLQRLGELPHQLLLTWLEQRRTTWPRTPNRHVLITRGTALGRGPVGHNYLTDHLLPGVDLERIRTDRVLHEALTFGPDPLRLTLVFNLAHSAANRYATFAQNILNDSHTRSDGNESADILP